MNMIAYKLREVSKSYKVEHRKKESVIGFLLGLFYGRGRQDGFWALKDISCDIKRGEVIGIIGENGSGKTTLLKLLLGVTKPTKGAIAVEGRVAGLLELGAGFQLDLTGAENIYLNGLILGMARKDIESNFKKIVDFAGIGEFIDAPVRIYSSGMFLRLGFAIAIGLDCDILLIDEVLAVGDEAFQRKCIAKIRELKDQGRTIIFVSHDLNIVRKLCKRVFLMDKGRIAFDGEPGGALDRYTALVSGRCRLDTPKYIEIKGIRLENAFGEETDSFKAGEELKIVIDYAAHGQVKDPVFGIGIYSKDSYLIGPNTRDDKYALNDLGAKGSVVYRLASIPFVEGSYQVSVCVHDLEEKCFYDHLDKALSFSVSRGDKDVKHGLFAANGAWALENKNE